MLRCFIYSGLGILFAGAFVDFWCILETLRATWFTFPLHLVGLWRLSSSRTDCPFLRLFCLNIPLRNCCVPCSFSRSQVRTGRLHSLHNRLRAFSTCLVTVTDVVSGGRYLILLPALSGVNFFHGVDAIRRTWLVMNTFAFFSAPPSLLSMVAVCCVGRWYSLVR